MSLLEFVDRQKRAMTLSDFASGRWGPAPTLGGVKKTMQSAGKSVTNSILRGVGLRTAQDDENDKYWGEQRNATPAQVRRARMMDQRKQMIDMRNHYADQGLGVNASTMSPTHIFSRISRAANLHGGGQIGNMDWGTLFRAGIGDNSVLDRRLVKPAAESEAKDAPLDFGFKPGKRVPLEEAHAAWSKSKRGPADNTTFLEAITPVIDQSIKMYGNGVDAPYLRSRARLLALDAAGRWEPNKSRLNTFLLSQMQPLRRAVAKSMRDIKVPEAVQYKASRMREAEEELRGQLDRDPTDEELSERMHVPMKELSRLRKVSGPTRWSGSFLEADEQPAVEQNDQPDLWTDFVYHDLGTTDKLIFEHRTGYNGKPVLGVAELARKLGLSAGMISKRAEAIAGMIGSRPKGW